MGRPGGDEGLPEPLQAQFVKDEADKSSFKYSKS